MHALKAHVGRLARATKIAGIATALLGLGSVAEAAPILSSTVVFAHQGEQVVCMATNVTASNRSAKMTLLKLDGTVLDEDDSVVLGGATMVIGYNHPGIAVGFYRCQLDIKGAGRRAFRARLRTESDSALVN